MTGVVTRAQIVERISEARPRLAGLGVLSLAVFGSAARDDLRPGSDVDVLVEFDGPSTFDRYMDLKLLLEDLLGRRVDLVTRRALRPHLASRIASELVHVTGPEPVS